MYTVYWRSCVFCITLLLFGIIMLWMMSCFQGLPEQERHQLTEQLAQKEREMVGQFSKQKKRHLF